jgi:general secretion pathway protein D
MYPAVLMLFPTPLAADCPRARGVRRFSRLLPFALVAAIAAGCAASAAMRQGRDAERRQDYDRAVVEYTKAVKLNPDDTNARLALDRARLRAGTEHFQRGRRFAATGQYDQALIELELASELNPTSSEIETELQTTRNLLRARVAVAREGKTELETLMERARDLPPPGLDLPQDVTMPDALTFREASSRMVYQSIAQLAGISIGFDPAFREAPVTVDLRKVTLQEALSSVADITRTFFRVTAPRTVLVIPDTPAKRREYEEEVVRVFYLSNADLKETMDLMRMVLDARRISPTTATNALTIKDTPERIAAAGRLLAAIDKARPEVIIDVELLEVERRRLTEYGLQLASPGDPPTGVNGVASVATDANGAITLRALGNLTQSDVLLTNLPSLYYRLLKTDASTRTLANPQLRTSEGLPAQARFGDRVPVPTTTFAPIAQGGVPQQPITSYAYENIGVNIDITPRTHHDDEVTLALRVAVQSISGAGFGGLPTFANREINTTIRLRDGETNMLAGLIRDDERKALNGIPGLSDIPLVGRMFGHSRSESNQTDIILTLTPHIVRVLQVSEEDLRAFRVGRDSLSPGADTPPTFQIDLPPRDPVPPQAPPPAQPDQPAAPVPGTVPGTVPGQD